MYAIDTHAVPSAQSALTGIDLMSSSRRIVSLYMRTDKIRAYAEVRTTMNISMIAIVLVP